MPRFNPHILKVEYKFSALWYLTLREIPFEGVNDNKLQADASSKKLKPVKN